MDRQQFIGVLKDRLRHLPFDEIKNAVDYYEEYFDEAGVENEQAVINELGNPADIASKIISEFALKGVSGTPTAKKGIKTIWIVILGIVASPIALPLILGFLAVIFALLISLFAVILSFGAVGISLLFAGIVTAISSLFLVARDFPSTIFFMGSGLVIASVGAMISMLTWMGAKYSLPRIVKAMAKFLKRGSKVED